MTSKPCFVSVASHPVCLLDNGLYLQGQLPDGEVNFEQDGEVYPTLVSLLKDKSKHFAENIAKQVSE